VAANGKSGQFQSGKFNEYEWLLSARSGRGEIIQLVHAEKGKQRIGHSEHGYCLEFPG
jgi:hypothetical protein